MRIINCCGYGNTGCTAQTDFLSDHAGVAGVLRPYHELGVLKCVSSFGGVLLSVMQKWKHTPTKEELKRSLMGQDPKGKIPLTDGGAMHLRIREILATRNGEPYEAIVDNALQRLPEAYNKMDIATLLPHMQDCVGEYVSGLIDNLKLDHFDNDEYDKETSIIGFKNDPPGAYPLFASVLGGLTSAVIRDPRDTTFDFNRHYGLGHTMQTVQTHCAHYNAQLNSARSQIEKYEDEIKPFYKVIDFEKLVGSESYRDRYRDHMVGPRKRVRFNFDHEKSANNVGHYTQMTDEFIKYVEETCMANYISFREFLIERDMMLE